MGKTTKLLGLAIYEIKEVWKEPDELQQANYALRSLLKGLKFLRAVPPIKVPKGYRTSGHTWPGCPMPLQWHDPLPLVQEGGPEWRDNCQPLLDSALQAQPGVQQMLQPPVNLIRHPPLPQPAELPTLRRGRAQQVSLIQITASRRHPESTSPNQESEQRSQGELDFPQAALLGTPPPISTALEENQMEKVPPVHPQHPITCFPTHLDQAAAH